MIDESHVVSSYMNIYLQRAVMS